MQFFGALLNCLFYPNIETINYRLNHQKKKKKTFNKNKANENRIKILQSKNIAICENVHFAVDRLIDTFCINTNR